MQTWEGARVEFSNEVMIRRSREDVFAFVSNLENVPRWNYAIEETKKTSDGPVGVGTTYLQRRTLPSPSEEQFVITAFAPEERLAIQGDLGPLTGTMTYVFEETDGGTRLTNTADLHARGMGAAAVALIAGGRIREAVAANLRVLKELLEQPS